MVSLARALVVTAAGVAIAAMAASLAAAPNSGREDANALVLAKRQADAAIRRSRQLEEDADRATGEAAKARASASALAAQIEAAEADITAAEARVRIVDRLRHQQLARLAEKQEPVIRLTAALQMMGRRPPALALVQPGSLNELVRVRALLASTLPVIRARTSALRGEIAESRRLRRQAEQAVQALVTSREQLKHHRVALARFEAVQRNRSASLAESALFESDRALALGEEARELGALMNTRAYQTELRGELAELPGPLLRPGSAQTPGRVVRRYRLPVQGRLTAGMGEISDAGVHARGLAFETEANALVVAPRSGKIIFARPFRSYGTIVIVDHGGGWMSVITNLARADVKVGDDVRAGDRLGRTGSGQGKLTVELRRNGHPQSIAPLLAG